MKACNFIKKRLSNTSAFLWILHNSLFHRTPAGLLLKIFSITLPSVPSVEVISFLHNFLDFALKAHSQVWENFWQLKALKKALRRKILYISPQKLFSFSRYLSFYLDFLVMYQYGLIKKITFKFYDVTAFLRNNRNRHIAQYLKNKKQSDNEIWSVSRM